MSEDRSVFIGKPRNNFKYAIADDGEEIQLDFRVFHNLKKGNLTTSCGRKGNFIDLREDENPIMCIRCQKIFLKEITK